MNRYTEELLELIIEEAENALKTSKVDDAIINLEALVNDLKEAEEILSKSYKFNQLSPVAQQRAINDYRNALIADGVPTDEVDDDWGLCYNLQRYQLDYYANGERYER